MPVFRNRTVLEVAKGIKAFLNLEVGLTRGAMPRSQPLNQRAEQPRQPSKQVTNKDKKLAELRKELVSLRAELDQAKNAARSPSSSDGSTPMFFLIGRSKSGTSWLMRLLNNHPEILCRGEGKFFGKDRPKSLYGALARARDLHRWLGRNPWTREDEDPNLEDIVANTVSYLMEEKLKKTKKKIVGDKSPFTRPGVIKEIATICPHAKVVHIIRDGRDVAVSLVHHRWNRATDVGGPHNLSEEQLAKREAYREIPHAFGSGGQSIFDDRYITEVAKSWSTSVAQAIADAPLLDNNYYYEVRYEDLLADPVGEIRRLLAFLEADSSEEVARECVKAASFEQLSGGRTQGEEDSASFYRKGVADDWKNHFTERDKEIYKEEAGELLIRLGYEKDYDW